MNIKEICCVVILSVIISVPGTTQIFSIDNGHSAVITKVQRFGMVDLVGRFMEVGGDINYHEDPSQMSCTLKISVESYSSNNSGGEGAVKSPAFLDVATYTEIHFESINVFEREGKLIVVGNLTLHGTTREIEFPVILLPPFQDPTGKETIAVSAELLINHQDYGVKFNRKMRNGKSLVSDEIRIMVDLLAAVEQ